MAHIYSPNIAAASNGDYFSHQWLALRAMLKAGWMLKDSSDGAAKSSANAADPMNCKWVAPAIVQDFSTNGTAAIGAKSGKDYLFTGLSGLVSPTATNRGGSEGNLLVVTNATTTGNNVTWLITKVVSATSCYARPLVPAAHTTAGTPGTTITVFGHLARANYTTAIRVQPASTGALGTATVKFSMDDGGTYSAPVTIPTTGVVEIIDASGVATGIYIVVAGTITNAGTGTDYWRLPCAGPNDANTTTIRWVERSWLTSTFAQPTNNGWILLEGPCTIKVPFTAAPSGTFLRGENVRQATTLAEGEVMGVTYEPSTGAGYLVISPRLAGAGSGPEGWQSGYAITGDSSSASVTANGTVRRLIREVVFVKGSATTGSIHYQPVLDATENANRFGFLARMAGCTATVYPGGGGTNNGYPTIAYAVQGTGGAVTHATANVWTQTTYAGTSGKLQHFSANCIEREDISADGSAVGIIGQPQTSTTSSGALPMFMRLDGGEEGDLEPYAWWAVSPNTNAERSRTAAGSPAWTEVGCLPTAGISYNDVNTSPWQTWVRRDLSTNDSTASAWPLFPGGFIRRTNYNAATFFTLVFATNTSDPERMAATAQSTKPLALFPTELMTISSATKSRKGALRWMFSGHGNNTFDTFGGKTWMQANPFVANSELGVPWFMPYDGSTVPVQ